jgi:hypothetical protein
LPRAKAGVLWTRYRIRQAALDAAAPLGVAARELLAEIETADSGALPRLGAVLYRKQHASAGAPAVSGLECGGSGPLTGRTGRPARPYRRAAARRRRAEAEAGRPQHRFASS